jgi:hypothetical protein
VSGGCFKKNKDLPTVSCTAVDKETAWKGKIIACISHGELRATPKLRYKKLFHERLHGHFLSRMDSFRRSGMKEVKAEGSEEGRR